MDIERGRIINDFIEPNKKQYVIPVYQRNYEWSREQCVKLFEDIVNAYKKDKLHFCGSVVYAPLEHKHGIDYYVIVDGQQRLTTIYLLIKARSILLYALFLLFKSEMVFILIPSQRTPPLCTLHAGNTCIGMPLQSFSGILQCCLPVSLYSFTYIHQSRVTVISVLVTR